eukprot:8933037-Pyramimonas_sp.AAC.1
MDESMQLRSRRRGWDSWSRHRSDGNGAGCPSGSRGVVSEVQHLENEGQTDQSIRRASGRWRGGARS